MPRSSQPPPPSVETVLPFPPSIEPLRHVRSTILIASIGNLRGAGYFDEYLRHLPAEHHATLVEAIAGAWIPLDAAMAHYSACDALQVPESTAVEFGKRAVERIGGSMVGTAVGMVRQAGATPWAFVPHIHRFWTRGYDGGGVAAFKLGPKDARMDVVRFPLCESLFYRRALRGWLSAFMQLFCETLYIRELDPPDGPHSASLRAQWV